MRLLRVEMVSSLCPMQNVAPPPLASHSNSRPSTCGLAIGSLVCGLLFFVPFAGLVAIILGAISLSKIKHSNGSLTGRGMAIAGIIVGAFSLVFFTIGLLAAMAIPAFQAVREKSIEKLVVNEARMISSLAQSVYEESDRSLQEISIQQLRDDYGYEVTLPVTLGQDTVWEPEGGFSLFVPDFGTEYFFNSYGELVSQEPPANF